ncbi:putative enzyme related to lactoylglutathione lyase [Rossellomorea aquimaris]|uniref:Putative enzyme related to lactoylglutathione lyase n=2 Tax=Rossellomorea aquimaris TaxID=189382 RepID=A0A366EZL5_9BACI|nr:putative enzyme related to lactoylglutathione lyase [Rossellomorea aquimaris]
MMKSPIKNKVNLVFIPVSDIEKSKEWYSKILGIQKGEEHFDHLFVADMDGAGMILDTMPMWKDENGKLPRLNFPAIQFATDDIHDSYQFMKDNGVELVTDVQNDQYFVFKDPDGNVLMVCL